MQAHSFDLFDTCITRMHAYPRDLFYDLGLHLAPASASEMARRRVARRFQRARIRAEKVANWLARREGREHADIEGIYRHLRWFMRTGRPTAEMVQAELALEEESLYPIDETVENIRRLRAAGHRILFISDMYIPARLLGPLLQRLGVMAPGDGLYVSCDLGCAKHSGRLFQHVLKAEGIAAADLVHTGDNPHADIGMAQAHGIQTVHFTPAHLTKHEAAIAGSRIPRDPAASWQAAFSRRCRLAMRHAHPGEAEHPLDGVIFGVIVPFLLAYALWALDDARKRGIQRMYFVARDGEVLLKIARQLAPEGIELRYLYGSRRAWLSPSIDSGDMMWKRLLAVAGNASAPRDIAERAGLSEDAQAELQTLLEISPGRWDEPMGLTEAQAFIDQLSSRSDCRSVLFQSAESSKRATLEYFFQEGLLDDAWALVDAGWSLNGQAALKRILGAVCPGGASPTGYYIGLAQDHLDEISAGTARAFCMPAGHLFSRRRVVVEHCFLPSTHASTIGYSRGDGQVLPRFGKDVRCMREMEYVRRLHSVAVQVAKMAAKYPMTLDLIRQYSVQVVNSSINFIRHPAVHDAAIFSGFSAESDMRQEGKHAQPLCRPLGLRDVWTTVGIAMSKKLAFKNSAWMWLEGSVALSSWYARWPLKVMLCVDMLRNRKKN